MTDTEARPGSAADLSRRMDRMEQRQEGFDQRLSSLAASVARVEQNQDHASELNKLRFDALDAGMRSLQIHLADFIKRVEGLVSGEVQTEQMRQGREMVADYQRWRDQVDADRAKLALLGRLAVLLVSSNVLAIAAAIYAVMN